VLLKAKAGVDCGCWRGVLDSTTSPILDISVSPSLSSVGVLASPVSPSAPISGVVVVPSVSPRSKLTPFSKVVNVDVDSLVATGQGKLDGGALGVPVVSMVREVSGRLSVDPSGDGITKSLQRVPFSEHLCLGGESLCQGLHYVLSHDSTLKSISVASGASPLANLTGTPLKFSFISSLLCIYTRHPSRKNWPICAGGYVQI
jgi:hypothetical protein